MTDKILYEKLISGEKTLTQLIFQLFREQEEKRDYGAVDEMLPFVQS